MTEWEAEMYGVKQMIHKFANIPYDDVVGKFTLEIMVIFYDAMRGFVGFNIDIYEILIIIPALE